ncbi:hypothetical protein ACOSP7_013185 [Xanthoceras sorbifolium]
MVRLDNRSCECGMWAVSGIPCKHALACISKKREPVETYVYHYLKKPSYLKTYCHLIHPIPDERMWPQMKFETVLLPLKRRETGRPKKQRRRGANDQERCKDQLGSGAVNAMRKATTAGPEKRELRLSALLHIHQTEEFQKRKGDWRW